MATGGETSAPAEDERISMMDIDDVHMLLQGQCKLSLSKL